LHSNFTYLCEDNIHIRKLHRYRKYNIVEWDDVKDAVAEQINTFVSNGGTIITIDENKTKKQPITVYGETTPIRLH
jgi:hypothetical protein